MVSRQVSDVVAMHLGAQGTRLWAVLADGDARDD